MVFDSLHQQGKGNPDLSSFRLQSLAQHHSVLQISCSLMISLKAAVSALRPTSTQYVSTDSLA